MRNLFIALAVVVFIPLNGFATEREHERKGGGRFFKELNLDKDQISRVKQIHRDSRREMVKLKSRLELKKIDFHEELQKTNPDNVKLTKLIDDLANLAADKRRIKLKKQVKTMAILTPEQKDKLMERMGEAMLKGQRGKRGDHDKKDRSERCDRDH